MMMIMMKMIVKNTAVYLGQLLQAKSKLDGMTMEEYQVSTMNSYILGTISISME